MTTFEYRVRNTTNGVQVPIRIKAATLAHARTKILNEIRDRGHPWEVGEGMEVQASPELDLPEEALEEGTEYRQSAPPQTASNELQRKQNKLLEELLVEARVVSRHGYHIVWALRGFGIALAMILLFGFTIKFH